MRTLRAGACPVLEGTSGVSVVVRMDNTTTHAPAFQLTRDKPVTEEDIAKVHIALEHCIRRGLTKQEAVATLQQLGVEALVTALVWEQLEEDNKQFFAAYHAHMSRTRLSCSA